MKNNYNIIKDPISNKIYLYPTSENYNITTVLSVIPNLGLSISLAVNCKNNTEELN